MQLAGSSSRPFAVTAGLYEPEGFSIGAAGLAALLAELVDCGCTGGVIEVSRASLKDGSLEGIEFDAAVVTDVAGTGLSAEVDLVKDRRAKSKLFRQVTASGLAVVNADDPNAECWEESISTRAGLRSHSSP